VARQILGYLLQHRGAADTAQGVRLWWLREGSEVPEALILEVLDVLVKRDWLTTRGRESDTRIFALNERNIDAVMRFESAQGERLDG
jgi:hypothetical protein